MVMATEAPVGAAGEDGPHGVEVGGDRVEPGDGVEPVGHQDAGAEPRGEEEEWKEQGLHPEHRRRVQGLGRQEEERRSAFLGRLSLVEVSEVSDSVATTFPGADGP